MIVAGDDQRRRRRFGAMRGEIDPDFDTATAKKSARTTLRQLVAAMDRRHTCPIDDNVDELTTS
jgi:hypothetical protein